MANTDFVNFLNNVYKKKWARRYSSKQVTDVLFLLYCQNNLYGKPEAFINKPSYYKYNLEISLT